MNLLRPGVVVGLLCLGSLGAQVPSSRAFGWPDVDWRARTPLSFATPSGPFGHG